MTGRELRYKFVGDGTSLGRALDDTSVKADRAGDSLDDLADDARRLDRELDDLRDSIQATAREIARSADEVERKNLFKTLAQQRRQLNQRIKVRDLIDWAPDPKLGVRMAAALGEGISRVGGPIADALGNVFGALPPQAQAAIGAGVVASIAAAAPAIGAVTAGAITGGVAATGIATGLMLASRDARVDAAGKQLGASIMRTLSEAAAPAWVPVTLAAIGDIRQSIAEMDDELERFFAAGAELLDPMVAGLTGGGRAALEGLTEALEHADPVVESIAGGMVRLGDAAGDSLAMIAQTASGASIALDDLFLVMDVGIRSMAATITGLSFLASVARVTTGGVGGIADVMHRNASAAADSAGPLDGLAIAFQQIADTAGAAESEIVDAADAVRDFNGLALSANEAERAFQQAVDDARAAMDGKVGSLNLGTAKGREYAAALDEIAATGTAAAQATYDQTGSQAAANAKFAEGRAALMAQARAYGLDQREARAYADAVMAIPTQWKTDVKAETRAARARLAEIRAAIAAIKDKTVRLRTIWVDSGSLASQGQRTVGEGTSTKYSRGGYVDGPGPLGVDSVSAVLAPGEGVLTVEGLRRLGGRRALDALNRGAPAMVAQAASGVPAAVSPRPASAAVDPTALARVFARAVRDELRDLRLPLVIDSRSVGEAQARDADYKARGER